MLSKMCYYIFKYVSPTVQIANIISSPFNLNDTKGKPKNEFESRTTFVVVAIIFETRR